MIGRLAEATFIDDLALPMPGRHNALNATAAIAVAHELGAPIDVIRKAIAGFGGVRRRFTRTGNGTASPSTTTMATIRSKSPRS